MATNASKSKSLWDAKIVRQRADRFVIKLNPQTMMRNPVMFVVEVGSVITTVLLFETLLSHGQASVSISKSRSGSGLRCCSPILPKLWRKAAAKRKPKRCDERIGNHCQPAPARRTDRNRSRREAARGRSRRCLSRRDSFLAMAKSSKVSLRWTNRRSPENPRR